MREIKIKETEMGYYIYRQHEVLGYKRTRYRTGEDRHIKQYNRTIYITKEGAVSAYYKAKRRHEAQLRGEPLYSNTDDDTISGDARRGRNYN